MWCQSAKPLPKKWAISTSVLELAGCNTPLPGGIYRHEKTMLPVLNYPERFTFFCAIECLCWNEKVQSSYNLKWYSTYNYNQNYKIKVKMIIWVKIWVIIQNFPPFHMLNRHTIYDSPFSFPPFVYTSISLSQDSIWICNHYSPTLYVPLRAEEKCAQGFQLSRLDILIWLAVMDPGVGLEIGIRCSRRRKSTGPLIAGDRCTEADLAGHRFTLSCSHGS